jgi:eukaryotic translation initiation factor 2-alpha kinase 4
MNMLLPSKKSHVSCTSLLSDMAIHSPARSPLLTAKDVRTPMPYGSPEMDYFRPPVSARSASRWKEDWEELELLVSILLPG